ncbi:hypothetical protein jhhlp_003918 [Lomentospora prolificans]|uniref:mRNA decay factor PAT1 domain-containing protein n=1 Tax=Lomentospora prolificans TaxID=41688 RepID=A0A2N3NA51_9PEZI|nr:hypothetical protein jhhlp_003918 [Lomentospora prolificans]
MSFFGGFSGSRHNSAAPGFSQAHDPFSGLSNDAEGDEGALEFDDTYDGLGDQLDETDDAFNDDTFGDSGGAGNVGKDFDFFGRTAQVSTAIEEEQLRFSRQQPSVPKPSAAPVPAAVSSFPASYAQQQPARKPARTGYEKYKDPEIVPDLHVDHSIWGTAPPKPAAQPTTQPTAQQPASSGRKVMSLEEVEAAMRAQAKSTPQPTSSQQGQPQAQILVPENGDFLYAKVREPSHPVQGQPGHSHPVQILQRPQGLDAKQQPTALHQGPSPQQPHGPVHPTQILQNPNRLSGDAARVGIPTHPTHASHGSGSGMTHVPLQVQHHLSEEEKAAILEQETKRAKRNHKIWVLSKDNGLMTPQDKNFITRIQLQQLVTATGIATEDGEEVSLNDDFYYQVHASIRAGHRQNPTQPLHNFAQTYLFQTGSRHSGGRRHARAAENHVQRMEQQVQRAVEAAKNKPKNPQLVIAGSLGKISYSNAKTPKPLLNIKRQDGPGDSQRNTGSKKPHGTVDRRSVLRNIEKVYSTLMKLEDHARHMPPPDPALQAQHEQWLNATNALNAKLWDDLKVHEPIGATTLHPFIAFLSFNKGKKAIPRVFRHLSFEQRATILTMIIFHLDQLDVVKGAQINTGDMNLNAALRENIELFSVVVMPSIFQFFNDTNLDIVDGALDLINDKLNVDLIAKTRIGTSILTLILSRAELLKQAGGGTPEQWSKWESTFNTFFNIIEPTLPHIFPGSINSGEDIYVWQLLAAIGVSSSPEQQQRLVLAVKDRVMGTVSHAKTLPQTIAAQRLSNVNLFMQSIGLDVELLG